MIFSRRTATSADSSRACLSAVVRKGSEEAMKSAARLGSWILAAMVCSSSESVGEALDDLLELEDHVALQRLDEDGGCRVCGLLIGNSFDLGHQKWLGLAEMGQACTRAVPSVKTKRLWLGILTTLWTVASVPYSCNCSGCGRVLPGVALGNDDDRALIAKRLNQLDRAFATDGQGQHGMGKEHGIANREDGQRRFGGEQAVTDSEPEL